ncbi:MAG: SdrD B-like domain-containing protein [Ferruginibacter sp.]
MNKNSIILFLSLIAILLMPKSVRAQSFIEYSHYAGGSDVEDVTKMQVINGETYLVGFSASAGFPVTNGSVYKGNTDLTVTKYGVNGNVLYSVLLGSIGFDNFNAMQVINGEVYILSTSDSTGYPVTNGSVFKGRIDIVLTKLDVNGNILFATYLGGTRNDFPTYNLTIIGDDAIIGGRTQSTDFPTTAGSYNGGLNDGFITKVNMLTGTITSSLLLGGSLDDNITSVYEENGFLFLIGTSFSVDVPVTIGNSPSTARKALIYKLSASDFSIVYSRYLGGDAETQAANATILNGEVHMAGFTFAHNFPVTNGTGFSGLPGDYIEGYYAKLNSDGSIGYCTYLSTEGADYFNKVVLSNGEVYLAGNSLSNVNPQHWYVTIFKINSNGSIAYSRQLSLGINFQFVPTLTPLNGDLYVTGVTNGSNFPVTNGSQFYNGGTGYFTRLDPSGNIVFSGFLGQMSALLPAELLNNKFYLLGETNVGSYPVTDSSVIKGDIDNILAVIDPNGVNIFGSYIGGTATEKPSQLSLENNVVFFSGRTNSLNYPVTDNILEQGSTDQFLTKISFCPDNFDIADDTLSPKVQSVCKFGLAQVIVGKKITLAASGLPVVYLNGVATQQNPMIEANYQWQLSNSPTGPWMDIPTATFKDYRPTVGASDLYYRRLAFTSAECGASLIHTSDTASALVNNLTAPIINIDGPFVTCPGSSITIGGSPTVTGGSLPYVSYVWDMGADPIPNPVITPGNSTIYTLVVTDAAGCQQIGQAPVFTFKANAGPDKNACGNVPVKIGTIPVAGVPGIIYAWSPGTGLSSTTEAQPFANPAVTTDYELILTVPKSGGGTCSTFDSVRVTPVAAPVTPNFAGPDKVMCLKSNASLGTPPEPGFIYTWSPGSYLTSNTTSTTLYYAGNLLIPNPDPATLYLTAQKDGCSFSDQVIVTTIESRAGLLACGPRIVGLPDRTPNVNETYSWTIVSGPGNFTGATNLPQVPVSASIGGTTIYGLTVSYNGHNCFSTVEVPETCIGCNANILVNAVYKCPSFGVNQGDVELVAQANLTDPIYTWSPQAGLDVYTGSVVHLTDNVPRLYTVTATDINDTSIHCIFSIMVNDPAFSLPVFTAPDVTGCVNTPIQIGEAPVAGYTYEWTGPGLSSNLISNPMATVPYQTTFPVKVTDGNGCEIHDEVVVNIQNVQVDAGHDWEVCNNALVQLGTAPQPNTTYLWEPQASPWQNGTDQFSAQPQVLIATNITFTVTASTPAGCVSTDTVNVTINNVPTIEAGADTLICLNGHALLGSPAQPGVIYQWSPAAGLSNANIAQPTASPAVTTTYTLVATFPGSCAAAATDEVTITVSSPSFTMPNINFCPDDGPFALGTAAPPNMVSYTWAPAPMVSDPSIANPNTLNPPPNVQTVYSLTVVNTNGCSYTGTVTIIPIITAPIAGNDTTICLGQSTPIGSASNVSGQGISYHWSPVSNLSNASSPNPVFTSTIGGVFTYVLTKFDESTGCKSRDTVVITVVNLFPLVNSPTVCENTCVQIGTSPSPGAQYQWTPTTGLSNPNIANPIACVDTTTVTYHVFASDINGCFASATVVVGVNNLQAPRISIPPVTVCLGDNNPVFSPSITPVTGNYSYLWSPDNGTLSNVNILNPTIIISGVGTSQYLLQVTDNVTGCTSTAIGHLTVNNCSPFAIIGDYMWYDTTFNGIQDPWEFGVSGMIVKLFNSADFNVATTVTDADGLYLFSNVPPGNGYYVTFSLPAGYLFTYHDIGGTTATNNSKVDINGRSHPFNLAAGETKLDIDAGIIPDCLGPVPVTLLSFTGYLHNRQSYLRWQTTSENNNHYFDVERSNNGTSFSVIGRVPGNGTSSLPHNYSLIDPAPFTGMNYYRLNQVDFDGRGTYSNIVPIRLTNDEVASVFYNNQSNTIQVILNSAQDNLQLKLYASNGQLMKAATAANNISSYTFELPALSKGIYLLQIMNNKFTYSKKLLISR